MSERGDMLLPFYTHKIAELLVPEHSLQVLATYHDPNAVVNSSLLNKRYKMSERDYPIKIVTKKVDVHPAHQQFSAHSTVGHFLPEFQASWKSRGCKDTSCKEHFELHLSKNWRSSFRVVRGKYKKIGIEVPKTDETDWCLNELGHLVFFEFEHLDHDRLFDYLSSIVNPTQVQRRAYQLLLRYEKIFYQHYDYLGLEGQKRPEELTFNGKSWLKVQFRKLISSFY